MGGIRIRECEHARLDLQIRPTLRKLPRERARGSSSVVQCSLFFGVLQRGVGVHTNNFQLRIRGLCYRGRAVI